MSELAHLPNPFRDIVVQDAWQATVDLPEIHAAAFASCLQRRSGLSPRLRGRRFGQDAPPRSPAATPRRERA
jgi:hypothetical protein